ncbi:protein takeout-like [Pseudomyrmex gracilis]|uniref:protein takeout-like n=1 Tax=Pseudomyrmex gracilis TaxID=219809 RepID=UPI000994B008|nr:protein takeout-like [Pseudomyrmex gracilis]
MAATAKATLIAILVATIGAVTKARDLPEFLHVCQLGDPHYDVCVGESVEYLKPYLKIGVPEYNIPSLEPLKLKKLVVSPANGLRIHATDVNVYGASNFHISKVKVNLDTMRFAVNVELPNISVEGKYDVDGKVLLLPIRGSGPMSGNFSNCIGACKISGERYFDKNGVEKLRIKEFRLKVSVGKGSLKLDNLFDGERVLGDVINSAINNNFDLFTRELMPLVEMALSDAFQNIADNIVEQFTLAQLFPGA